VILVITSTRRKKKSQKRRRSQSRRRKSLMKKRLTVARLLKSATSLFSELQSLTRIKCLKSRLNMKDASESVQFQKKRRVKFVLHNTKIAQNLEDTISRISASKLAPTKQKLRPQKPFLNAWEFVTVNENNSNQFKLLKVRQTIIKHLQLGLDVFKNVIRQLKTAQRNSLTVTFKAVMIREINAIRPAWKRPRPTMRATATSIAMELCHPTSKRKKTKLATSTLAIQDACKKVKNLRNQ